MRSLPLLSLIVCASVGASSTAWAAATPEQVEMAAVNAARAVDGTLVPCPATWRNFTESRRCVRVPSETEDVKAKLNRALGDSLVTAWRAQSNPIYSYNYLRLSGELVGIVAGPASRAGDTTLLVLDSVPSQANVARDEGGVKLVPQPQTSRPQAAKPPAATPQASKPQPTTPQASKPQPSTPQASRPQPSTPQASKPQPSTPRASRPQPTTPQATTPTARALPGAPAYRRTLALQTPRVNGEDVRQVQNRLMDVAGIPRGGGGDGWFGPVTSATVRVFQSANGLRVTGAVDRATWERLFSTGARPFDVRAVEALLDR